MYHMILEIAMLVFVTSVAGLSACPSQQAALQSSANNWPTPTGDVGSFISSYSSAHSGVFSGGCQSFTDAMPSSLRSPYESWVTEVDNYSNSIASSSAVAASTCVGFVANVVIALPRCRGDAAMTGGSSAAATSGGASATAANSASSSSSSTSSSSNAGSSSKDPSSCFLIGVAWAFSIGVVAVML